MPSAGTVDRVRRPGLLRQLDPLRHRTARWVADHLPALRVADPAIPEELHDRQADNWRPLVAIADEAGGTWAEISRAPLPAHLRIPAIVIAQSDGS